MKKQFSLGSKLRKVRDERGLSQRELAQKAGISTNAVSLIERDENSPSVATLQNLAAALNVKMSYFFDDEVPRQILHVKRSQRPAITSKGVKIEGIGGELNRQEMEPFLVSLEPYSESGDRQVVHTGHEFVYCLTGCIDYIIDGEAYNLEVGDFLMFEAHLPHIWRNRSAEPAEFLLVLQTPGESNEPIQKHFASYPSLQHLE